MITKIEMEYMEAVKRIAREMSKPKEIDWEARRYEIAKDIFTALISNSDGECRHWVTGHLEMTAEECIIEADHLIAALKKSTPKSVEK